MTLSILDMKGRLIDTLVDRDLPAGPRSAFWHSLDAVGEPVTQGIYCARLVARRIGSGSVLFADSVLGYLWQPDLPEFSLGWTSSAGTFETRDELLFPNVLGLRPLVHTNICDSLSTFTIPDTVTIVLTDTLTGRQQSYDRVVRNGENRFDLVWAPSTLSPAHARLRRRREDAAPPLRSETDLENLSAMVGWRLYWFCPNPF